jgi:TIR domain
MAGPRVFVSYSAKACQTGRCAWAAEQNHACPAVGGESDCSRRRYEKQFIADLVVALEDTVEVMWDERALIAGEDWEHKLGSEFAKCRAALVVLTESSVDSHYVPLEAMVLNWRRVLDEKFLLIPIFFFPLDENTIKQTGSRFYGIGLEATQGIKHKRGQEQSTFQQILSRLKDMAECSCLKEIGSVHRLAALIGLLPDAQLEAAAAALELEYEWRPGMPRPFQLALAMLQPDLAKSATSVGILANDLTIDQRKRLFEILVPCWVDLGAAMPIWQAAIQPMARKLLVVNSGWQQAAKLYALRAWSHTFDPVIVLRITAADDGSGEGYRQAILQQFKTQYLEVGEGEGWDEAVSTDEVVQELKIRSDRKQPVYVAVFHESGIAEQALLKVQRQLPVAILYVRQDLTPDQCGPETLVLQPLLTAEREKIGRQDYLSIKSAALLGGGKK